MKRLVLILIPWGVVLLMGCSLIGSPKGQAASGIDAAKVLRKDVLRRGGDLLVIPFTAGENVTANDELDRVALRVVQGVAAVLDESSSPLKVLGAEDAGSAQLILRGRFSGKACAGWMARRLRGRPGKVLGVEGELLDRNTGEVVLTFSHRRRGLGRGEDFEALGLALGQDIGRFLLTHTMPSLPSQ